MLDGGIGRLNSSAGRTGLLWVATGLSCAAIRTGDPLVFTPTSSNPITTRYSGFANSYYAKLNRTSAGGFPATDLAKVTIFGGFRTNGAFTQDRTSLGVFALNNQLNMATDSSSFPLLPSQRAGVISFVNWNVATVIDPNNNGFAYAPVYVFGGWYNNGTADIFNNDLLLAKPNAAGNGVASWAVVDPLDPTIVPEPRAEASGAVFGSYFYLFGGRDANGVFGDTWAFQFSTNNWTKLHDFGYVSNADLATSFHNTNPPGTPGPLSPPARYAHSMLLTYNSTDDSGKFVGDKNVLIIMAGGMNGVHTFDDLWAFDPISRVWNELGQGKAKYPARAYGALFRRPNQPNIIYFGGGENSTGVSATPTQYASIWKFDILPPSPPGPAFKRIPNAIISGVAGGILLSLVIMVVVLKLTDRNRN